MTKHDRITTTVSTKGQVILPKAIRERRGWKAGTRLVVEETPDGLLLKQAPLFPPTRPEDVYGMLLQARHALQDGRGDGRGRDGDVPARV